MENRFIELAKIDVSKHVEKKNGLSYLSWAWAVDQLMRNDQSSTWEFHAPQLFGESMMVSCTVTAFGKPLTMHLPVMDHRNQAIKNPDAFQVNKNMMRCLVKAIACHGIGLYIYAGEDLPADDIKGGEVLSANEISEMAKSLKIAVSIAELGAIWKDIYTKAQTDKTALEYLCEIKNAKKKEVGNGSAN